MLTFLSSSINLPSTRSSQQVVAGPSGTGVAPGSGVAAAAVAALADSSLAGKAVLLMKIRNLRFCFIGRFNASYGGKKCNFL